MSWGLPSERPLRIARAFIALTKWIGAELSLCVPISQAGIDPVAPSPYPYWVEPQQRPPRLTDAIRTNVQMTSAPPRPAHSLAYMLCAASEMFRHYDFDPMDLIIIHAIMHANGLNVMKHCELDRQFGSVKA